MVHPLANPTGIHASESKGIRIQEPIGTRMGMEMHGPGNESARGFPPVHTGKTLK